MKTTVVEGVLTSYELVLAILFRWCAPLCIRNIVWLWRSHMSGHWPDHHTLATWYCSNAHVPTFELQSIYFLLSSSSSSSIPSLFCFLFLPLEMWSTLVFYACFVVSILGTKGTTPPRLIHLFSRHNNSGSCGVIRLIFLGGGWPDDVRFPCRSGDSPPLVIIWAEDVSIMRQSLMM